jgi:hypothetical protein
MTFPRKKPALKPLPLSEFCRFEVVEVDRERLKNAPYNPRKMTPSARESLKRILKTHGLVEPPVWNERTGNLVGGHQRLGVLDTLHRSVKYRLKVARIDVPEKEERELNLALNNPSAQGDWDMDRLEAMIRAPDINLEGAGFNLGDVFDVFGMAPLAGDAEKLKKLAETIRNVQKQRSRSSSDPDKDNPNFFMVFVFADKQAMLGACESLGLPARQYHDGRQLLALLGQGEWADAGQADEVGERP